MTGLRQWASDQAGSAADPSLPQTVQPAPAADLRKALGYVRMPCSGHETDFTRHAETVAACCDARGCELLTIVRDTPRLTGDRRARPGLRWALEQLTTGTADALVVPELRHLSDTAAGLAPLLDWFAQHGSVLVAVDIALDTSTDAGRIAAHALADVGQWERQRISARTREGLEAARANGTARGRPAVKDVPELRERIVRLREEGMTLQAIAEQLNEAGVPTVRGGALWRPSSVQAATGYQRPSARSRRHDLPPSAGGGTR